MDSSVKKPGILAAISEPFWNRFGTILPFRKKLWAFRNKNGALWDILI